MFPNIARVIGYVQLALFGVAAAGAVTNIVMGVSKFILVGLKGLWSALTLVTKIYAATVWITSKAVVAWNLTLKFLRGTLLAVRMAAIMAGIGINLMSWPVLLVIGAIALLAAGCYLLIKHWDDVKAAVMNTAAFTAVAGVVEWLAGVFSAAWQWITDGWNSFIALLTGFSPSQALSGMASGIVSLFDNVWQTIKGGFLKSWNWIVGKLNKIPGVDISLANESQPALTTNTLSTGGELKGVDKGGISKTISSNSKSVTDNSRKIGEVHFHTKEALSPSQLMEWQELNA
ncbi:putative membrane protein [Escherichia coli 7-233-03_S4_C1]|nr:putative membrane protein [Escherichia coli 7-233-03_S4_C1]KEN54278.1 putative membrane protein [Escherichia coli 7-233-03_S4_C3]